MSGPDSPRARFDAVDFFAISLKTKKTTPLSYYALVSAVSAIETNHGEEPIYAA